MEKYPPLLQADSAKPYWGLAAWP